MLLAVARFELRFHRHEFLTWLAAAVFLLLTFGFAASDAVELVGDRGAVPKSAPWTIAHAVAGVTAFGQLVVTLIAATAVLRDEAARTQALLLTTPLTRTQYVGGRLAGTLLVLLLVHLAIPLGLAAGALLPGGSALAPADAYLRPFAALVLPNVLLVGVLLFAAGTLGRSLVAVLAVALLLVALWQTGIALAGDASTRTAGALLDPFGNGAVIAATAGWEDAERATRALPLAGHVAANRLLWTLVAALVAAVTLRRARLEPRVERARPARADDAPPPAAAMLPDVALAPLPWLAQAGAELRLTLRWAFGERGLRVLALLALLNVAWNAWRVAPEGAAAVLAAVELHARLFLILVATVYAGELVWRERDLRAHEIGDALPTRTAALVPGRVAGVLAAGLLLCAMLLVAAAVALLRAPGGLRALDDAAWWVGAGVWFAFARLLLLSLLVHAVVRHKTAAHLLLVSGWVAAVALAEAGLAPGLLRYAAADAALPGGAFAPDARPVAWRVLWFGGLALLCGLGAVRAWPRGVGWARSR